MKKKFILILGVFLTIFFIGCKTEVSQDNYVNNLNNLDEKTKNYFEKNCRVDYISQKIECDRDEVEYESFEKMCLNIEGIVSSSFAERYCLIPLSDYNNNCNNSNDCLGFCEIHYNKINCEETNSCSPKCSPRLPIKDDCYLYFEYDNGKIIKHESDVVC